MAALTVHNDILAVFSDSCNFVINIETKHYENLKSPSPTNTKSVIPHDQYLGLITYCSCISNDGKLYAVADQKNLIIWSTSTWSHVCTKTLERGASKIIFTPNRSIVVADKTGDVYLFSLNDENPKGTLLLGHLSILLDVLVTPDEKFIVTCDRDEKIRVSHLPNAYNIECFCLGHTEFVTKITLLDNTLLSCSGDGTIKFWSYLKGIELRSYSVSKDIEKSHDELNQCLITNLSAFSWHDSAIICISVHKYNGILVYKCTSSNNYDIVLVQEIACKEPLNFTVCDRFLWILNCDSTSSILDAWLWNGKQFEKPHQSDIKDVINIVNRECSNLNKASYIDLSVLYKKYIMNEEKRKKIKLEQ